MKPTIGQRFADWVTAQVGSWRFIIIQSIIIAVWMWANWDHVVNFDPAPFVGLNLLLSFEAAFTAPFLLMSANRQAEIDRQTLQEDLQADKITEKIVEQIKAELDDIRDALK